MEWRIGCSGFSYKEWKGTFYPQDMPSIRWFDFYAEHFNTLELNVTFYHFPRVKTLQQWYKKSPAGFLFAVKAPRLITHYKKFNDCKSLLDDFYTVCSKGLQEKLGPVLFQLPAAVHYSEAFLETLVQSMQRSYINVIEFRHESWWRTDVYTALGKAGIIFCGINHPTLPTPIIINNDIAYYRLHGVPGLYFSEYDNSMVKGMADGLLHSKRTRQAFVLFNNTATMAGINNANMLKDYITR
ncbi:DUF72 domain-containing protein [Panacibacter sp. DH6]|uniref:DUF72 domain-containing protein n=1 Tax=Panacibacter microcysteis TaxID=2793269 RepID=A0A931E851_9BACT|nr:DUF72 domain-containing protein [Panacibacter microcysteis]MBG9376014.1 DUF72 domain-containing protein [Panacibacter microcysteis]